MNKLSKAIKLNEDRFEKIKERNQFAQNKAIDDHTKELLNELQLAIKGKLFFRTGINDSYSQGWNDCIKNVNEVLKEIRDIIIKTYDKN